jgi:hypothetical protein
MSSLAQKARRLVEPNVKQRAKRFQGFLATLEDPKFAAFVAMLEDPDFEALVSALVNGHEIAAVDTALPTHKFSTGLTQAILATRHPGKRFMLSDI